jgi:hypothetical protein
MARDYFINGECLVTVKGRSDSLIAASTQFGLSTDQIRVSPRLKYKDMQVEAWGEGTPETQWMLADLTISMNLIHFDEAILEEVSRLSMGGAPAFGQLARAGTRMGGNLPRFSPGNNYVSVGITSPVAAKPWRFYYCYIPEALFGGGWPLGAEKSVIPVSFRCIPYTTDPYGGGAAQPNTVFGTGAQGAFLFDRGADS